MSSSRYYSYNDQFTTFFGQFPREVTTMFNDPFFQSYWDHNSTKKLRTRTQQEPEKLEDQHEEIITLSDDDSDDSDLNVNVVNAPSKEAVEDDTDPLIIAPVDMYETETSYEIYLSIPGATARTINIDFNRATNELTIDGDIKQIGGDNKKFLYSERPFGRFSRMLQVPDSRNIEPEKIKATYEQGVLHISICKAN